MAPEERRIDGWEKHAVEQQRMWLALTPDQRLDWLEEAGAFGAFLRAEGRIIDVEKLRAESLHTGSIPADTALPGKRNEGQG